MNNNDNVQNLITNKLNLIKRNILASECTPPLYFRGIVTDKQSPPVPIFDNIIKNYQKIKHVCQIIENNILIDNTTKPKFVKPENWWPVGLLNYIFDSSYIDISPLLQLNQRQKLSLVFVAQEYFNLSNESVDRILNRTNSLFNEVYQERKPNEKLYFEIKPGVYYMLKRHTVIKFLTDGDLFFNFLIETAFGLDINNYPHYNNFQSFVGVKAYCPEGLCVEIDFAGITLYDVVHFREQQPLDKKPYYAVRMLRGYDTSKRLATDVIKATKQKLLDNLPFFIIELVNIITQISHHGLVNPDIKLDNIVVDIITGQPKMIDFQLILPEGEQSPIDNPSDMYVEETLKTSHHVAIEYIKGKSCDKSTMTFSLCQLIYDILIILKANNTNNNSINNLLKNSELLSFIKLGISNNVKVRPNPVYTMAQIIGATHSFDHQHLEKMFRSNS